MAKVNSEFNFIIISWLPSVKELLAVSNNLIYMRPKTVTIGCCYRLMHRGIKSDFDEIQTFDEGDFRNKSLLFGSNPG